MNKRIRTGLLLGLAAGIIDVIPMILQHLSWDANLSAFSMWIITGFFMGITQFQLKGIGKGLFISFAVLLPALIIIGWKQPSALIPVLTMTALLGSLLVLIFQKIIQE